MEYIIKSSKSIGRRDYNKKAKKNPKEQLILNLGLQNFRNDVLNTSRIHKSKDLALEVNLLKAGKVHLPKDAKRFSYTPTFEYGVIYIPVNRLKMVYQTDKATDHKKVSALAKEMKDKKNKFNPIEIGYNYDVHDGHHRWIASQKAGFTHVPCQVKGTDPEKVQDAKIHYREVWKSCQKDIDIFKALNDSIEGLVSKDFCVEKYMDFVENQEDYLRVVKSIFPKEYCDIFSNIPLLLDSVYDVNKQIQQEMLRKSKSIPDLSLVLDLKKGELNKHKLIKRRVAVQGKSGTFYREQWVDPNKDVPNSEVVNHDTYSHSDHGIKEMEARQSTKFPVLRVPLESLKISEYGYHPDRKAISEFKRKLENGEKLPPVRINTDGRVLSNHALFEMGKELGLTHIPVIVMGNPELKKKFENKYKEDTYIEEKDEEGNKVKVSMRDKKKKEENLLEEVVRDLAHFKNFVVKKYPKDYIMEQAKEMGIEWKETTKAGTKLPKNSNILWMRAHEAILDYIKEGWDFEISEDQTQINRKMKMSNKNPMEKYFLQAFEKFGGDKQQFMEYLKKVGVDWKLNKDPSINWMNASKAAKDYLAQGKMLAGIRTRQKNLMSVANAKITDQIKQQVTDLGKKHGKKQVMDRADELGIQYNKLDKKGNPLALNCNVLWMRAHEAISLYIATGNKFAVKDSDLDTQGLLGEVGKYGNVSLPEWSAYAMDLGTRNNQTDEQRTRQYAKKCFKVDRNISDEEAEDLYNTFMDNAKKAKVMLMIDPFEQLSSGVTLLEQMSSNTGFQNNIILKRGTYDKENIESNEGDLFGSDYTYNVYDKDRPIYGVLDLFNTGLKTDYYNGSVAFVMKDDVKQRSTGCQYDSDHIPYGQEGKWTKALSDPHQLLMDRWYSKWKQPNKSDGQRKRAMDAVLSGKPYIEDKKYFETHIHGGVDFKRDVDYLLVPSSWKSDKKYTQAHKKLQDFANLQGISIKYD